MTERTGTQGSRIWTMVRFLLVVALVLLLWVAARRSHAFVARHPAFTVDPAAAVARAPAEWRKRNFAEVEVSLAPEEATREALRCLRCDLEFTAPKQEDLEPEQSGRQSA